MQRIDHGAFLLVGLKKQKALLLRRPNPPYLSIFHHYSTSVWTCEVPFALNHPIVFSNVGVVDLDSNPNSFTVSNRANESRCPSVTIVDNDAVSNFDRIR